MARAAEFSYKLGLELRDDQPLPRRMTEACKAILAESGGRLEIRPFPNAQLGSSQETLTQVRQGSLEMVTTSFGLLSSVIPTAGLPTLGFIFDSYDKIWSAIDGDLGNFTVIGPSGSGKTVVMNFLAAQAQKFSPRTILFDKDRGAELFIRGIGGSYDRVQSGEPSGFNPMGLADTPVNRAFLRDWLGVLLKAEGPEEEATIAGAVDAAYANAPHLRRLPHQCHR